MAGAGAHEKLQYDSSVFSACFSVFVMLSSMWLGSAFPCEDSHFSVMRMCAIMRQVLC